VDRNDAGLAAATAKKPVPLEWVIETPYDPRSLAKDLIKDSSPFRWRTEDGRELYKGAVIPGDMQRGSDARGQESFDGRMSYKVSFGLVAASENQGFAVAASDTRPTEESKAPMAKKGAPMVELSCVCSKRATAWRERALTTVQPMQVVSKSQQAKAGKLTERSDRAQWLRVCNGRSTPRNAPLVVRLAGTVRSVLGLPQSANNDDVEKNVLLRPAPFEAAVLDARTSCQTALVAAADQRDTPQTLNLRKFVSNVVADIRSRGGTVDTMGFLFDPTDRTTLKGALPDGIVTSTEDGRRGAGLVLDCRWTSNEDAFTNLERNGVAALRGMATIMV
jgi:hypothetical protein